MRLIFTLSILLCSTICFSQIYDLIRKADLAGNSTQLNTLQLCGIKAVLVNSVDLYTIQQNAQKKDTVQPKIILRCGKRNAGNEPMLIIDGTPFENLSFKNVDPKDIESVYVLKDVTATAIYGYKAKHGVIVITTKQAALRKFIIKDFLDGNPIPGATVSFISADKKDTLMMAANDSGFVNTEQLKPSIEYLLRVSSVGYCTYEANYKNEIDNSKNQIMLKRGEWVCTDAIVACSGPRTISCGFGTYYSRPNNSPEINENFFLKSYPNPVQRGKSVTIETTNLIDVAIVIKLFGLDGKLLLSQNQKTFKGLNRFTINTEPCWSAGIYIVQIYANGKLSASEKIVIQ